MTRGKKGCTFIEAYCKIPEGAQVGQPMKLMAFQKKFILDVSDNPHGTSRALDQQIITVRKRFKLLFIPHFIWRFYAVLHSLRMG